jgi:hypothetical protein
MEVIYQWIIRYGVTILSSTSRFIIVDSIIGITLDSNGHNSEYPSITVDPSLIAESQSRYMPEPRASSMGRD